MQAKITTTITTYIDLDTMQPDHTVDIETEEGFPQALTYAAVAGGAKALLNAVKAAEPRLFDDETKEND